MTWEQIAELHAGGVTFGSHTSTHEILTMVPTAQAEQEIVSLSRGSFSKSSVVRAHLFSYPNGDYSEQVRELVAQGRIQVRFPESGTRRVDARLRSFSYPRVNVCEYHLVDSKGDFSPLIFDYAVVWSAAKGLLSQMLSKPFEEMPRGRRHSSGKAWDQPTRSQ